MDPKNRSAVIAGLLTRYFLRRKNLSIMKGRRSGFTLIELLMVIAIVAVLTIAVVLALNPAELMRQSRDSNRVSDMSTLKTAISLYLADVQSGNIASSTLGFGGCYLSTPAGAGTSTARCGMFASTYLVNTSSSGSTYRKTDSTGWVPVSFNALSFGVPFTNLPTDPTNNASFYYGYVASSTAFELNAFMESTKYRASGTADVVSTDGGDNNSILETGNRMSLNL